MSYPNARFWAYINGGPVKLTLQYGESVSHREGGPTEEGYDWRESTWKHEGGWVNEYQYRDARDCDGRLEVSELYSCDLDQLREGSYPYIDHRDKLCKPYWFGVRWPNWVRENSRQRDHFAESMNY